MKEKLKQVKQAELEDLIDLVIIKAIAEKMDARKSINAILDSLFTEDELIQYVKEKVEDRIKEDLKDGLLAKIYHKNSKPWRVIYNIDYNRVIKYREKEALKKLSKEIVLDKRLLKKFLSKEELKKRRIEEREAMMNH